MSIILTEEERASGFVRSVRHSYLHKPCGRFTALPDPIAEDLARRPQACTSTWCHHCKGHFPVGQFDWLDGQPVGS